MQPTFGMSFVSPSTDRTPVGCYDSDCASGEEQSIGTHTSLTSEFSQGELRCARSKDKDHSHSSCTTNFITDSYGAVSFTLFNVIFLVKG